MQTLAGRSQAGEMRQNPGAGAQLRENHQFGCTSVPSDCMKRTSMIRRINAASFISAQGFTRGQVTPLL